MDKKDCEVYDDIGRFYKGNENVTMEGKPCLKWTEAGKFQSEGDHNYCRKTKMTDSQDWCYVAGKKRHETGLCAVVTCGRYYSFAFFAGEKLKFLLYS